ncbi:hypothetical protein GVN21_16815 [Caulobacter sp. SLTY]|uniref:hypothetical protein n=1 Tax=Caulobacter sp. SLTY TaxID=2683262 RepID=UPI001412E8E2|nr:hypothetical protein [Caulobacter sp. SLTY]NBB17030.1 hypothetical protein [Caulobacter sp. SLTY]
MVALFATLSACATGADKLRPEDGPAQAPVIEVRTETILVCPDEIYRDIGPEPEVPDDAEVSWTDAGKAWIDRQLDRGADAVAALVAARKACDEQGVKRP